MQTLSSGLTCEPVLGGKAGVFAAGDGAPGLAAAGFAASPFADFQASWPIPTVARTNNARMGRSVLMLAGSDHVAHGRCGYSLSYFGCSLCPLLAWQAIQTFRGRTL